MTLTDINTDDIDPENLQDALDEHLENNRTETETKTKEEEMNEKYDYYEELNNYVVFKSELGTYMFRCKKCGYLQNAEKFMNHNIPFEHDTMCK